MSLVLRSARPSEAGTLSDLAFVSKAHWGYSAAFMEACRSDLNVSAAEISAGRCVVAEQEGMLAGFYQLAEPADGPYLKALFVSPGCMNRGVGRALWGHALDQARRLTWPFLLLDSDPHAEAFYRALGALKIGEAPSTVFPGRVLPLMRMDLS